MTSRRLLAAVRRRSCQCRQIAYSEGVTNKLTMVDVGAKIEFRAVQGMTTEWLQRVVDCHVARSASMGHNMPEMAYCPLQLKDIKATVSSTGNGFAINVTSDDSSTAQDIIKRAQALKTQ